MMLHNEARELLVKEYEQTHDVVGIAAAYGVKRILPIDCQHWFDADYYCP